MAEDELLMWRRGMTKCPACGGELHDEKALLACAVEHLDLGRIDEVLIHAKGVT
jgi:hypothetical protein